MQRLGWLAIALCAMHASSLPVSSDTSQDDTKVMKCLLEVISTTLSKPKATPIRPECLQTLREDERIISILRHENLLKELQQLAAKGASVKARLQKKSSRFEDELSKVLEHPEEESNSERENLKEESPEADKNASNEEKNSMEEREPSEHESTPEEEEEKNQEGGEQLQSNEVGDQEENLREESVDNHITDDINSKDLSEEKHSELEIQPEGIHQSQELKEEEKEHVAKELQEEQEEYADDGHEEARSASEGESIAESISKSSKDDADETQRKEGSSEDVTDGKKEEKNSGSDEKSHEDLEDSHVENDLTHEDETSHVKESSSEETGPSSSKELEDAKRWNKMDELAKELTSKKRMAEKESLEEDEEEDPDRSMKIPYRVRKYNFNSRERDARRPWHQTTNEDSSERGSDSAFRPSPEEKKDEEGSANRRTEDQELESLSAIEAELEKVAHKLHELRRG
ncbi:chromogranin-A [Ambystoma mexicanum]|uniref:chromogranin-A n=1 Tax=Ambystoma mexicanum TaxID=8296 RepID=UPI0037E7CB94